MDGRNPAPPKKPWNADSSVNTNGPCSPMVSFRGATLGFRRSTARFVAVASPVARFSSLGLGEILELLLPGILGPGVLRHQLEGHPHVLKTALEVDAQALGRLVR